MNVYIVQKLVANEKDITIECACASLSLARQAKKTIEDAIVSEGFWAIRGEIGILEIPVLGSVDQVTKLKDSNDMTRYVQASHSVSQHLDAIASHLESLGQIKEAHDLDVISNTLDTLESAEVEPEVTPKTETVKQAKPFVESLRQITNRMSPEFKARATKILDDLVDVLSRDIVYSGKRDAGIT